MELAWGGLRLATGGLNEVIAQDGEVRAGRDRQARLADFYKSPLKSFSETSLNFYSLKSRKVDPEMAKPQHFMARAFVFGAGGGT